MSTNIAEPTPEMIEAGARYLDKMIDGDMADLRMDAARIYTAMRSSAPQEPDDALVASLLGWQGDMPDKLKDDLREAAERITTLLERERRLMPLLERLESFSPALCSKRTKRQCVCRDGAR